MKKSARVGTAPCSPWSPAHAQHVDSPLRHLRAKGGWEIQGKARPGEMKEKQICINMAGECLGQDKAVLEEKK